MTDSNPRGPTSSLPSHFGLIDGLRGLAALAVVIFHYHHFYLIDFADRANTPEIAVQPFGAILFPIYEYGRHAVELFWVISGFVFSHVYLNRPTTLHGFVVARIARLYPLHLATLLFVALLQVVSLSWVNHWQIYGQNDLGHFILQLGFASNWSTLSRGLSFNGPIWSVSLEIISYGLFFLALPFLRRFGLGLAVALFGAAWVLTLAPGWGLPLLRSSVFVCAAYFFLGCSCYCLLRQIGSRLVWMASAVAVLVAAVGISLGMAPVVISAVSVALVLWLALLEGRFHRFAMGGWLKRLGDMSYSIYLVHVPLQMLVLLVCDGALGGTRAFADHPATLPIYLLVVILVSDWVYRGFEIPAGAFLRRRMASFARKG